MLISELKTKKILILGFGAEGQDSFLFLRNHFPDKSLGIADKKEFEDFPLQTQKLLTSDKKVILYCGKDYVKQINTYDVIIKSPGIPLLALKPYVKKQVVTSQTNIFFANCPGTVVGVTGTKGKSTTASLIYHVLESGGVKVHLIGNIGEPALSYLQGATKDDVFVYELSSFQLETAVQSPHIAVFLNLYEEHLDHHGNFKAYESSKANITKFQTKEDYLIFNAADEKVKRIAAKSKAKQIAFVPKREKNASYIAVVQPVLLVAKLFKIQKEQAQKALRRFTPLPHRLQPVGIYRGISFYNDSLATIPEATIEALNMLGDKVTTLIVGGYDRGIQFGALAERIHKSKIHTLILLPTTGEIILKELEVRRAKEEKGQLPNCLWAQTMAEAVRLSYEHTRKGKICLLSPAAASFNMFSDYKHRGEEFIKWVNNYAKKART